MEEYADSATESRDSAKREGEFIGVGEKSALVCESDRALRERIGKSLEQNGYNVAFSETASDALATLRLRLFDVIVLNEFFGGENPGGNEVLKYLAQQNMSTRRRFFVALTGRSFATMDNMAAFNRSVNIVVNLENLDDTGDIVRKGVADHTAFYQVFNDVLRKAGKI
jgi:CheY-like chemotaxis protein